MNSYIIFTILAFAQVTNGFMQLSLGSSTKKSSSIMRQQIRSQDSADGRVENKDEIKCAFFRAINPRTKTYKEFREDLDKGGLDPELTDVFGWPMVFIQQGPVKSLLFGAGLDTLDLDGWVEGVMSHKDLMWPYRAEVAELLKAKEDKNGQISAMDIWEAKKFTSTKHNIGTVTFASFNEIPLIFLRNGGDVTSGKVNLEPVLQFLDGNDPGTLGRITKDGLAKVTAMLPDPKPTPLSCPDKPQLIVWILATVASISSTAIKKLFAKAA
uniref:Thioredoxin-like fold domain-containing protein n=1 Tax=Attheya septentrionalis TaxID=420275 RepID=A0A7S2UQX8_9STRA|mmetsp:Transcript_8797/g.15961  ORF Transcript_8797/g.15961 Transcript_8797/m.15961 type:complete len:269 (+) Transcript_8797:149-955(+)